MEYRGDIMAMEAFFRNTNTAESVAGVGTLEKGEGEMTASSSTVLGRR